MRACAQLLAETQPPPLPHACTPGAAHQAHKAMGPGGLQQAEVPGGRAVDGAAAGAQQDAAREGLCHQGESLGASQGSATHTMWHSAAWCLRPSCRVAQEARRFNALCMDGPLRAEGTCTLEPRSPALSLVTRDLPSLHAALLLRAVVVVQRPRLVALGGLQRARARACTHA